ncbi:MAG: hypothetical protein GEV09_02150 [Pseudonocardiaceae bacterium]|nr:hypothetical protein [Pseudonocardiaceae bacterium]
MPQTAAPVLLLGSCPGDDAEHVMRTLAGGIGDLVPAVPDGERDDRRYWVNFLAYRVYSEHEALDTMRRPRAVAGKEEWIPSGYDDFWRFRAKNGVTAVTFGPLGYARHARSSYDVFRRLREQGVVPDGARFQVCLPLTESGTRIFMADERTFDLVWQGYQDAMRREIAEISDVIPSSDLLVQWDVCIEVLAVATGDRDGVMLTWQPSSDPFDRYQHALAALAPAVPGPVPVGLHLCYGDLYKRHLVEPEDLAMVTRMANTAVTAAGRRIDYVHFPVPVARDDEAYFAPLAELSIGDAALYAGLIHDSDGVAGCLRRLAALRRHYPGRLGVATECGFGGRPTGSIPDLLALHRTVAEEI